VKRYAINRHEIHFPEHESTRYEVQAERKSEEEKLNRLKKLLLTKVQSVSDGTTAIRAA
jgi:hypothetical protein